MLSYGEQDGFTGKGAWALGLLIVAYLFLGGVGAGAFAVLSLLDFRYGHAGGSLRATESGFAEGRHLDCLLKRGYAVSFVVLALGAICLLADLGRPEIAFLLFTRPTTSYISIGTFSLTALLLCVAYLAIMRFFSLPAAVRRAKPIALAVGFAAALFVMAYTGVFLQSMKAVPLWDSPLLIVMFFLSALSTGIALVMACSNGLFVRRPEKNLLSRLAAIDLAVIISELVVCLAYLLSVSMADLGAQSVERLLLGDHALVFLAGFVLCGLVLPGILNAYAARCEHGEWIDLAISGLVLIGGFCLRLSLVEARIHTSI